MSRSKRPLDLTDHHYGLVRFRCPSGHRIGTAFLQVGRYGLSPRSRVQVDGPKVLLTCPRCLAAGRRGHFQASWRKVQARLVELEKNIKAGAADYEVGGNRVY